MNTSLCLGLVISCLVVTACSLDASPQNGATPTGSAPTASGSGLSIDDFVAQSSAVYCHEAFACCTPAERDFMLGLIVQGEVFDGGMIDEPTCEREAMKSPLLAPAVKQMKDEIAAGRIVYHPERAAACVDAARRRTCAETFQSRGSERRVVGDGCDALEPRVGDGGACVTHGDCTSKHCRATADGTLACGAAPAAGDPCRSASDCASDDLYCDALAEVPGCAKQGAGACSPKKDAKSAACSPDECKSGATAGGACVGNAPAPLITLCQGADAGG